MKRLLIFTILLSTFSCSITTENEKAAKVELIFEETGLKSACLRTIKTIEKENHGNIYVNDLGKGIKKDSIMKFLYIISQLDDFKETNSKKYLEETNEYWEKSNKAEKCFKIEKIGFIVENPDNLEDYNPIKTAITLTDFDLYLNEEPNKISLRFIKDSELIQIVTDKGKIYKLSEIIPVGLGKSIQRMDSLKQKRNASR